MKYKELWHQLEKKTKGFKNNMLIKDAFSDFAKSQEMIMEVFSNLNKEDYKQAMRTVRVFNNYTLESKWTQNIVKSEPRPDENVSEWMKRSLETDERFIILNNAERYSDKLAKEVAVLIESLNKDYSFPLMNCEANLILGKYGYTPLGIHCDSPLGDWHRVFQINTGPGKKKIHFWKREKIQKLMGSSLNNFFVPKEKLVELIPYADSYELGAGDALFFSPEEYHIAESDEFSVSLGLVLFNEKKATFLKKALHENIEEVLCDAPAVNENISIQERENELLQVSQSTLDSLTDPLWVSNALSDLQLKYHSNRHLKSIPLKKEFPYGNIGEMKDKAISLNQPFKMYHQSTDQEVDVFIRGQKLMLIKIPGLEGIIDGLNRGDVESIPEVLARFDKHLEVESVVFLLKKFYEYGGIRIE